LEIGKLLLFEHDGESEEGLSRVEHGRVDGAFGKAAIFGAEEFFRELDFWILRGVDDGGWEGSLGVMAFVLRDRVLDRAKFS
jgi:hypothetical protein